MASVQGIEHIFYKFFFLLEYIYRFNSNPGSIKHVNMNSSKKIFSVKIRFDVSSTQKKFLTKKYEQNMLDALLFLNRCLLQLSHSIG